YPIRWDFREDSLLDPVPRSMRTSAREERCAVPDRLRILHLTAPALFGGLERVVSALARGHHAGGHDVHVAAILGADERDHPFVRSFEGSGIATHALHWHPRAYWNDWTRIGALCAQLNPQIVHSHSVRTDVIGARAAARRGFATLTTVHGASL